MKPYYEEKGIAIYNADCREVLPTLEAGSVGQVLTSPPYNLREGMKDKGGLRIGRKGSAWARGHLQKGYGIHEDDMPYPEYVAWQKNILLKCWRTVADDGAIYFNHKPRIVRGVARLPLALVPEEIPVRQIVIWDRCGGFNATAGAYMPLHEWILILAKENFKLRDQSASGVGDVWRIPPEPSTPHPAPFPLMLAKRAIETTPAETILDPFMGSGTTLRAAKDLGRKAIGIEIEERYCEIAAKRLRQQVLQFEKSA